MFSTYQITDSDLRDFFQLIDLGEPAYSYNSHSGCDPQKNSCIPRCGARGVCDGGLNTDAFCQCSPGYTGDTCEISTTPVSLDDQSFAKIALSFAPDLLVLPLQLRLRTRQSDAIIVSLTSENSKHSLILNVSPNMAIVWKELSVMILSSPKSRLCVCVSLSL